MRVSSKLAILAILGMVWVSARGKAEAKGDEGLPEPDPMADKLVAAAKEEESEDEIEVKPENQPDLGKLPTEDELLDEVVNTEKAQKEAKAKKGDGKGRFGSYNPRKIRKKWVKRWSSPGSKWSSSSVSWGSKSVTKSWSWSSSSSSSWSSSSSGGFSVSGSSSSFGSGRFPSYLQKYESQLSGSKIMTTMVISGGRKYTFRVSFAGSPKNKMIFYCKVKRGKKCNWKKVSPSELDKYLKFGLITWKTNGTPMFGLLGTESLGIPNRIYGFGTAPQMTMVINRLFSQYLVKKYIVKKKRPISKFTMIWDDNTFTKSPSDYSDDPLIWDIPYWLPPKNRANIWQVMKGKRGVGARVVYQGNINPIPIQIPEFGGTKIKIDIRQSVPSEWMEMFQLPQLKIKHTNIQKVICQIPGACKNNNPDIIKYWEYSYGPGGRTDVKYWKKPGTRGPDDEGPGSLPGTDDTDSREPGTDGEGPGSPGNGDDGGPYEPGTDGTDSREPGTDGEGPGSRGREEDSDGSEPGTDGEGPGSEGNGEDSDEPEPGNNDCIARCTAKCDEQGNIKGTVEGEYNAKKRRKREADNRLSSYVNFVRASSCKSDVECQESFSNHLKRK